jgi:hypothetical protein
MNAIARTVAKTMATVTILKGSWRILTNNPTVAEKAAIELFRDSNQPARMGVKKSVDGTRERNEYIIEINTSDWVYPVLERLNRKGIKFRLGSIPIKQMKKDIAKGWCSPVPTLIESSTFAWANASYAFFLVLNDAKDTSFTINELGLYAYDSKKLPKRLQEVTRITQMRASGNMREFSCNQLTDEDLGLPEIYFDGMVVISQSFAVRMCFKMPDGYEKRKKIAKINKGKMGRLIFRCITPFGLIKGLAVIVPDEQIEYDVVYHESALKSELGSDDPHTWHATAFEHPHLHTAMWDMQSMYNNHNWLLTEERFNQDAKSLLEDFQRVIASGELPDWILYQETDSHDDSETPAMDHAVSGWKKSYQRWQKAGMDVDSSSNLLFMAFGSLMNQMEKAAKKSRWWVPMSNSFMATVNTWEALRYLAKFDMPEEKRNIVFFDERFGVVIPGDRFSDTADLHDTWDQDGDQAKFIRIKLWSSSPILDLYGNNHGDLRDTKVIAKDLVVPCTPEEAIDVCVIIRSPNGPGGYSIHQFDAETMPWLRVCEERVPVIDLATAPKAMASMFNGVTMGEIPVSVDYDQGELSRGRALSMIEAQLINPGVGTYANLIMAYSAIFGPSYPTQMPAIGNDIIDACQQTADYNSFVYLRDGFAEMRENMLKQIKEQQKPVDEFLYSTRFRDSLNAEFDEEHYLKGLLVNGKFSRMNEVFLQTLKDVASTTKTMSFERRLGGVTRNFVMDAIPSLSPNAVAWARQIWNKYDGLLKTADQDYKSSVAGTKSRVYIAFMENKRTKAIQKVVEGLYADVSGTSYPTKYAVALYRWIITPAMTNTKYGLSDRLIFQNGDEEQQTVMDLLIQGIQELKNAK